MIIGGITLGLSTLDYTYLNESCGDSVRSRNINFVQLFFPVGGIIYTYVIKYLEDWRKTSLYIVVLPSLLINIPTYLYILETPLYLIAKKNDKYLIKVIKGIA